MNIDPIRSLNKAVQTENAPLTEEFYNVNSKSTTPSITTLDPDTKQALDKATGLMQTIVSDKMSDKVIRKMPSDEYLQLLSLLDEIISGSIDKRV
ncbi:MAG: hypothetical protein ACRC0M_04755 [Legionella sp.]